MQNKIKQIACGVLFVGATMSYITNAVAVDDVVVINTDDTAVIDVIDDTNTADMENVSANAVADYQTDDTLFQQITDLEQEKVLMQLEKERAQLNLDLDRLAAEKIKLHMEIDALSGRADERQRELDAEKAKLEAEAARLARERETMERKSTDTPKPQNVLSDTVQEKPEYNIAEHFKLINVIGVGSQLQATLTDTATGQKSRISVGGKLGDWDVTSISLNDGVVFSRDGQTQTLNISNVK